MNPRWKNNEAIIAQLEREIVKWEDEELTVDLEREIANLKKPFEQLVSEAKDDLRTVYLDDTDKRPWAVAWSGGKDSTCVMGLVVKMLEELPAELRTRRVYAVMSDTMMENPNLEEYMREQVFLLNEYAKEQGLPIEAQTVVRPNEHSYFYLVLGKGYFLPQNNGTGRWCTDRLKIQPQNKALREIDPSFILMGVRLSESVKRKSSIKKWRGEVTRVGTKIGEHVDLKQSNTFMPIVDFTVEDVWQYLQRERLGWSSTHKVRTLYREATGECGFTNPKKTEAKASVSESCGARFGCWNCPVVLKDRSTEEMSKSNPWMAPLLEWRMLQLKVMGDYKPDRPAGQRRKARSADLRMWESIGAEIRKVTKSGHKMDGKRMLDRKTGEPRDDQGTLTIEARRYLLDHLLETERKVNELRAKEGLAPISLISEEEVVLIRARWEEDRKERPWLITNVNGFPITKIDELIAEGERLTGRKE